MKQKEVAKDILQFLSYTATWITFIFTILILLGSCAYRPPTESWNEHYKHLQQPQPQSDKINETDYYIIFLVAAHHLDYWDNRELAYSLISYSKRKGDIGHSWIYLKGIKDGKPFVLEGSQSGQLGKTQPRFFDGVHNYIKYS